MSQAMVNPSETASLMKNHFKKAGVPSARCHLVTTKEEGEKFLEEEGFQVFTYTDGVSGLEGVLKELV